MVLPTGLVLLVGPPGAGKSSFAAAWVSAGHLDQAGIISCDTIRAQMFGPRVHSTDDPAVFEEIDTRVRVRLAANRPAVVDATNVLPAARARMMAWANRYGRATIALRFSVDDNALLQRNLDRPGHDKLDSCQILHYAKLMRTCAATEQLRGEGITTVIDVPENRTDAVGLAERLAFNQM